MFGSQLVKPRIDICFLVQELQGNKGSRLHGNTFYDFLPKFVTIWPLNCSPLEKVRVLMGWSMDVDKFDCSRDRKESVVLFIVDICRATSNFSEKNMARQGASCIIAWEFFTIVNCFCFLVTGIEIVFTNVDQDG